MIDKFKVLRTTLLLLSMAALAGCFEQDYSICPPERNLKLDFNLISEENFMQHISSVDAFIYDAEGAYIRTERITESQLARYQGMTLDLDPGDYKMVFWANLGENTGLSRHDDGESGEVGHADHRFDSRGLVTVNGDQLWYGPSTPPTRASEGTPQENYALTIPEEGDYSDEILFTNAHRSLEIYVGGLSELPTIEIEGLPTGLEHMGMEALAGTETASHETSPVDKDGESYAATVFDTFYFDDMEEIMIVIRSAGGDELYRISLADAIAECEADPDARVIQLVFTFMHGTVEVTMPGWQRNNPGFEV